MPSRTSRRANAAPRFRTAYSPLALATHLVCACMLVMVSAFTPSAHAQAPGADATRSYDIPAGPLAAALTRFAGESGVFMAGTSELTQGKSTNGLRGAHTVQQGFTRLLGGTGLEAVERSGGSYVLRAAPAAASGQTSQRPDEVSAPRSPTLPPVTVTASADQPGSLPKPYSGGQVARGGRLGLLGDKDFMDTPFSTTTYTAQTIEDQQARTIADVVYNNPSFRVIYPDNDVTTDFIVRGNKVKALDAAYAGLYGLTSPGVEALERIEIISGANALLNGLGPIGGVGGNINQVPKRALELPLTRLTTGFISKGQFGVHADISRRYGPDNQFGLRFNGAFSDGDTPVDGQGRRVALGALALDYRGDGVRVTADLGFRKNDSRSPSRTAYVAAGFQIPAPPKSGQNWQQPWSYDNTKSQMGAVRAEVDLSRDITAYAALGASNFEEAELFANSFLLSSAGALRQSQVYWPLYRHSQTAEAGLRGKLTTGPIKHSWAVATSALHVKNGILLNNLALTNTNIYAPVFIAQPSIAGLAGPGDVPQTGAARLFGVAVADTLSAWDDQVQLTLGVRRQSVKADTLSATTGATTFSYDKSATTPGVGIVVKAAQNVSLYANYIEGLQQGPTAPAGTANVGEIFSPYVSKQHEAGVKVDFGGFATTLSVYQLKTPNGVTSQTTKVYSINGEQRTRGVELNTFGEVARGVRLLGGAAFVDAKQTRTAGGTNDGKQVTGAPKVQFNLGGELDLAAVPGLTLSARAIHTSKQYLDVANLQPVRDWTRYDAGVRYRTQWNGTPTTIRLNVENVFNKSFWAAAVDGYLIQSSPRTFLVSASFDF